LFESRPDGGISLFPGGVVAAQQALSGGLPVNVIECAIDILAVNQLPDFIDHCFGTILEGGADRVTPAGD